MNYTDKIELMLANLSNDLHCSMNKEGFWEGKLSASAISTAVALTALTSIDKDKYKKEIDGGCQWLLCTMKADGTWGDSEESPSNMTATLLSYAALYRHNQAPESTKKHLTKVLGAFEEDKLINGVLRYYGTDLTFSVPILVMCAVCGVIHSWNKIPPLPFELSVIPQHFYRFLRLPVVSYAIPALIAVGLLRFLRGKRWPLVSAIRDLFINPSLRVLTELQPAHGGFLEAAPLTGFVAMCMSEAGFTSHEVTQKAASFLITTLSDDNSWRIDTDLSAWVTSLATKALTSQLSKQEKQTIEQFIRKNNTKEKHRFTGAIAGGWGWTNREGCVPDADDTPAALLALYELRNGEPCEEIYAGIEWILSLQNSNGGVPTFCKGWGKLPFDRSSPDITAHAVAALSAWIPKLESKRAEYYTKKLECMIDWLATNQQADGSWIPLWFGDQDNPTEQAPVYGTATVCEHLMRCKLTPTITRMNDRGIDYLKKNQNEDGGWGGIKGLTSKVTFSGRALTALAMHEGDHNEAMKRAVDFLYSRFENGTIGQREAIGLYFARLWYSEQQYNNVFVIEGLNRTLKKWAK